MLIGYIALSVILLIVVNSILTKTEKLHVEKDDYGGDNDTTILEPSFTGQISGPIQEPLETTNRNDDNVVVVQEDPTINRGAIVAVLIMGAFVSILNQTFLNVALPRIMTDLNISANTAQWLITAYMLTNGVLIPISAFLMESYTTKSLFISAMVFFSAGSLICALSPHFSILLIGRVVQAVGAGIIMPLMMNIFLTIYPPEKRGAAMGIIGLAMIFAPAIGPTLSGWIVENYSWRLLFYIVLPIAILDIFLAIGLLKNVTKLSYPKFDTFGVIFSTLGFGGLLFGFSEAGNNGWGSTIVISSLVIGAISLIAFIMRELSVEHPMLEFRVFKYSIFSLTTVISMVITMAMFAAMILVPLYMQNIRGFTPIQSGLLLLPGAIIMGVMSPITGMIFDKIGARLLAITGLVITLLTTWQFSKLTGEMPFNSIVMIYSLRMFGMSMLMMPIMTAGLNQLPQTLNSHGTAMANTMRQVSGSLGTAFLVTIMSTRTNTHLGNYSNVVTADNPIMLSQISQLGHGLTAAAGLPEVAGNQLAIQMLYGQAAKQAFINGINDAFVVATGITAVGLILSFFISTPKQTS